MVWSDFGLCSVVVINVVVWFQTKSEEQMSEEQKAAEKAKPVSSTPVPGTPWCVVWTGDGRIFFYNPSQRLSVWDRPSDLKFRQDVDRMVQAPPNIPGASRKLVVTSHSHPKENVMSARIRLMCFSEAKG